MNFSVASTHNIRSCIMFVPDDNGLISVNLDRFLKVPSFTDATMAASIFCENGIITEQSKIFYEKEFKDKPKSDMAILIAKDLGYDGVAMTEDGKIVAIYIPNHKNYEMKFV